MSQPISGLKASAAVTTGGRRGPRPRVPRWRPDPPQLAADLLRAFELLSAPAVIVETSGRLVCVSRAAKRVLAKGEGVADASGFLVGDHPRATSVLAAGLKRAVQLSDMGSARHEVTLPCLRGRGFRLTLQPLRLGTSARTLVTFEAVAVAIELDPARLEAFFGLTRTEAQLSIALVSGLTVSGFAAERGCSEQTARTHLKHVFDKTACGRQVELVLVLLANLGLRAE